MRASAVLLILVAFNVLFDNTLSQCMEKDDYSGVANQCSKFLRCVNGEFVVFECPSGTLFDHLKQRCEFASNAVCLTILNQSATTTMFDFQKIISFINYVYEALNKS
jgi:hypothetical protein